MGPAHQHALTWHAYRAFESAALRPGHDFTWAWPLLGIADPAGTPRPGLAPVESAGLAAYHRDRLVLDSAQEGRRGGGGGAGPRGRAEDGGAAGAERGSARAAAEAARKAAEAAKKANGGGRGGNAADS